MTILRRILGSLLVILLLVGCQRDAITLPAPQLIPMRSCLELMELLI